MKLTDRGRDIISEICAQVFEDNPRDRVVLWPWHGKHRKNPQPHIFPGPPAQILLDLAPMHSELAIATRPYIWREVLVAWRSDDEADESLSRLERAHKPHIARFVRAIFVSVRDSDESEDSLRPIVTAIPLFVSLRGVCVGVFQNDYSLPMYENLANVIREHPRIDILSMCRMTQCTDLIPENSSKTYSLELSFCHENSIYLLLRPKAVKLLRLPHDEAQLLVTTWPADIWGSLEHLDPGADGDGTHMIIQPSLQKYLDQGRLPALKSLDLSRVGADQISPWLKLVRGLHLEVLVYMPDGDDDFDAVLQEIREISLKVRNLSIRLPRAVYSDEEDAEISAFEVDPAIVDHLSNLPNLERLTLTGEVEDGEDLDGDVMELGKPMAQILGKKRPLLRRVQLVFTWEAMDHCSDQSLVAEYGIHRQRGEVVVESVAPQLLEGTAFDWVQWR
ncbi:hypothetical protein DFH09DRAFT_1140930 [Mycena vulgaris]|nr:hypothetical protein DFH09DRAFT_1140930 [Mycena vulgaris]